jgi:hypothetical protein
MRKTIREYDWTEIVGLIKAEEEREGNQVVSDPELVKDSGLGGYSVRFATERLGVVVAETVSEQPTKRKPVNASPEQAEKMRAAKLAKKQAKAARQETVALVEAAAPLPVEQDPLLEKITRLEGKLNGHAPHLEETVEVVAATGPSFPG